MIASNKKLRVAVIGVGNMGKRHIRVYSEIPEIELVSIADIDKEIQQKISKKYHLKVYKDYRKMIEIEKLDIVSICVPTNLHYLVAKDCIKKNIHVLLEKPITTELAEGKELLNLSNSKNIKFLVGHIERFNPSLKLVKEMIDKGDLGKIIAIISRRVGGFPSQIKDSNIAIDLAIHDIDISNFLLGELPIKIYSKKQRNLIEKREDSVEFFLKYKTSSAYIQANWITPVKIRKLNITGTAGYLELDYIKQEILFYKSNYEYFKKESDKFADYIYYFSEPDKIIISVAKKEPLKEEILYFLDCIKNKKKIDSQFAVDALNISLK